MEFNNISELLNKLANDLIIELALEDGEISGEIIDTINEKSQDIYNQYEPRMYVRRYEFGNRNNIKITSVKTTNASIDVEFRNMTEGTTDKEPIDWMIEQNVYNYHPNDNSLKPRLVYEPVRQELDNGKLEEIIKKTLKSKGWEII